MALVTVAFAGLQKLKVAPTCATKVKEINDKYNDCRLFKCDSEYSDVIAFKSGAKVSCCCEAEESEESSEDESS